MSRFVCPLLLGHRAEIVAAREFEYRSETTEETRTAVVRRCRRCSHTWSRAIHGRWSLAQLLGQTKP